MGPSVKGNKPDLYILIYTANHKPYKSISDSVHREETSSLISGDLRLKDEVKYLEITLTLKSFVSIQVFGFTKSTYTII